MEKSLEELNAIFNKVQGLAKDNYCSPHDVQAYLPRIERMRKFYADKAPEAPERQAAMFKGFVEALNYATITIKMYSELAQALAELAGEEPKRSEVNTNPNFDI